MTSSLTTGQVKVRSTLIMEKARSIFTMGPSRSDPQPDILAPRDDDTDDTVFEVDPITHVCLNRSPLNTTTHLAQLSAFTDSVPDDHAPEVLLAYAQHATAPLLPEQSPTWSAAS